jgi:hypothetical protein
VRPPRAAAVLAIGAAAVAAAAGGCGDSTGARTRAQPATRAARAPRSPRRQPVPASLAAVESSAEDTVDLARAGERGRVVATARRLRRVAGGAAAASLRTAGVAVSRIAELEQRARLVERLAPRAGLLRVSLAANQVSGLMPALYARYADPVPPEVLELDYLDREAQLRSLAGDRAAITAATAALAATWTGLGPSVVDAGGAEVAARYVRHVGAMRALSRGGDAHALQAEAVKGLALVDELEHVFRGR